MSIKNNLKILKEKDIYSLAMFTLYQLTEIPEYSTISELPYILDKENMLKLCQYFGGTTIRIPTTEELYSLMHLILLYKYVNIDNMEFNTAVKLIGYESKKINKVKKSYTKLCKVLDKFNFDIRDEQHD